MNNDQEIMEQVTVYHRTCRNCGAPFATATPQQKICTETCRTKYSHRRTRAPEKDPYNWLSVEGGTLKPVSLSEIDYQFRKTKWNESIAARLQAIHSGVKPEDAPEMLPFPLPLIVPL